MAKPITYELINHIYLSGELHSIDTDIITTFLIQDSIKNNNLALAAMLISKYDNYHVLNLNNVGLTDTMFAFLLESILENKNITSIQCNFNKITDSTMKHFINNVSNNRFIYVEFRCNNMTRQCKELIAAWVKGTTVLGSIVIGVNKNKDYVMKDFNKINSIFVDKDEYTKLVNSHKELLIKEEELKQLKEKIVKLIPE